MSRKLVGLATLVLVSVFLMVATMAYMYTMNLELVRQYNDLAQKYNTLIEYLQNSEKATFKVGQVTSIHARIRIWKAGVLILDEYHAGAVTDIGDNQTAFWVFGATEMQEGPYMSNCTYISIGNQGTLNTASTQLPGEWNRTSGTLEDFDQSQLNMTCTFYPDASGPYTADCIGINWASSGDGNLYGYDTFTEVTGIDETFTINVEFQISVSHA